MVILTRTINQVINFYNSILSGKSVLLNGYTISSDGINWLVDDNPVDTINNKRKKIDIIIEKCLLAREFITLIGEDVSDMYNDYYIIYDILDKMTLLIKNKGTQLVFIYIVSTYVVVEQINKDNGTMIYDYFGLDSNNVKHKRLTGKLALKSQQLIRDKLTKEDINITQNFFYEMLFEGMKDYKELMYASILDNKLDIIDESLKYRIEGK